YGGFLITDDSFGDFELTLEAKPDWPADTGIYLRKTENDWAGIQVLVDHRQSGGIGGFFGNGIGAFHAVPFSVREIQVAGVVTGLAIEDLDDPLPGGRDRASELLTYAAAGEEFLNTWNWGEWNEFRIRSVG